MFYVALAIGVVASVFFPQTRWLAVFGIALLFYINPLVSTLILISAGTLYYVLRSNA